MPPSSISRLALTCEHAQRFLRVDVRTAGRCAEPAEAGCDEEGPADAGPSDAGDRIGGQCGDYGTVGNWPAFSCASRWALSPASCVASSLGWKVPLLGAVVEGLPLELLPVELLDVDELEVAA